MIEHDPMKGPLSTLPDRCFLGEELDEFLPEAGQPEHDEIGNRLRNVEIGISKIMELLYTLQAQISISEVEKELYTVEEVANILNKAPYTVREWCRLGRCNAEKTCYGRGPEQEWRIAREEIHRIQNEGLLPMPRHYP